MYLQNRTFFHNHNNIIAPNKIFLILSNNTNPYSDFSNLELVYLNQSIIHDRCWHLVRPPNNPSFFNDIDLMKRSGQLSWAYASSGCVFPCLIALFLYSLYNESMA